ncbi:hypothetical protein PFISCL1PPCAC_16120, partial [Pristionchus fissidentatus]
ASTTAERIRGIWKDVLLTDNVFADDDHFYLVGGDSFRLLKLINKLNREFNSAFSLSEIMPNLTIQMQATMIDLLSSSTRSALVRISAPKDLTGQLILLHPLIGGVQMPYRNLIIQLATSYEILGYEHPSTFRDAQVPWAKSIEELIRFYVEILGAKVGEGGTRRVFVGASMGALLAFEMASQLDIDTQLIVVDGTSNRRKTTTSITWDQHRVQMSDILRKYEVEDETLVNHMIEHSWNLYGLSSEYTPKRNQRITVHVFSCCGTDLGWADIATVKSVHRLTGDHSEILNSPNSQLIADFVRTIL